MNRTNIQATIDILKQAQKFDIQTFQSGEGGAKTVEELHACGNAACIAGYVGLSPHFQAVGGVLAYSDEPMFDDLTSAELRAGDGDATVASMVRYWGLPCEDVQAIVFGWRFTDFCYRWRISGMPVRWRKMTKEQAISLFEQLLAQEGS